MHSRLGLLYVINRIVIFYWYNHLFSTRIAGGFLCQAHMPGTV